MVSNLIINLVYACFMFFVDKLSFVPLRFNINESSYSVIKDFISFIFYILPIDGLMSIVGIIVLITGFRIFISIVKTIWDLLPFV